MFQTFSNLLVSRNNKIWADADLVGIWISFFKKNIFCFLDSAIAFGKSENCEHCD